MDYTETINNTNYQDSLNFIKKLDLDPASAPVLVYYKDEGTGELYVTGLSLAAQSLVGIKSSSVANQKLSDVIEPCSYEGIDLIAIKVVSEMGVTQLRGQYFELAFGGIIRLFSLTIWGSLNTVADNAENQILPAIKKITNTFLGFQSIFVAAIVGLTAYMGQNRPEQTNSPAPETPAVNCPVQQ